MQAKATGLPLRAASVLTPAPKKAITESVRSTVARKLVTASSGVPSQVSAHERLETSSRFSKTCEMRCPSHL